MLIITHAKNAIALPLSTISSARAVEGGWLVTDAQGENHHVDKIAWDIAVEGTPTATIPAQPGTYLITKEVGDNGQPEVWKTNILGWMVCADTLTRPVVLDPEALLSPPWQVLHPDGRVECSNGTSWDTMDAWLSDGEGVQVFPPEQSPGV